MPKARGMGELGRQRVREALAELNAPKQKAAGRKPGMGAQGRAKVRDSLVQFALSDDATKEALFNAEENFDAWNAATEGYDNARPEMLGENTNGQDSTRITYAQYFFNPHTMVGDMYVSFRGTRNRSNGNQYMYTNVPVYAAKRFYTALSKGKSINRAINGLEQFGYTPFSDDKHFSRPPATEFGAKVQYGAFGNVANAVERANEFKPTKQNDVQGQLPLSWDNNAD